MWKWKVLLMIAMLSAKVDAAATNIDSGFTQDGVTTYCQGVNGNRPSAVTFMALEALNNGVRCPIALSLTVSASTVHPKTTIDVTWKATVRNDAPNNIFPKAVDQTTKKALPIISSLLKLCRAGTNCASVLDLTPVGPMEAEAGEFDAKGEKALRAFKIEVNDVGAYVLVGKIALPGDPALNISAMEMVAFQKITVIEANAPLPPPPSPTPSPPGPPSPSANKTSTDFSLLKKDDKENSSTPATISVPSPTAKGVDPIISQTNVNATGGKRGFLQANSVLFVVAGVGVVLVGVVGYLIVGRRKSATQNFKGPTPGKGKISRSPDDIYPGGAQYMAKSSSRNNSEVPMMARNSSESGFGSLQMEGGLMLSNNRMLNNQRLKRTDSELLSPRKKLHLYSPSDLSFANPPNAKPFWSEDEDDGVSDLHDHSADLSEDDDSRWGDSVMSGQSEVFHRSTTRSDVESFAFRPTGLSVAESYDSRLSKYSEDSRFSEGFRSTNGY